MTANVKFFIYTFDFSYAVFSAIALYVPSGDLHVPGDPRYNHHVYNDQITMAQNEI